MESLICPSCTTIQVGSGRRCNWCGVIRPEKGWIPLNTVADPWLGTVLTGQIHVEQRISSVESLYRARDHEGRNYFARFRRINRLATPSDWTQRAARLRAVRSRRLARFITALEHDEYAVLLSEHVEGERLRDLLRRSGPLGPTESLNVALQIAVALEAFHEAKLTHGRLNPRGILISMDARGARRVTLISYGLASGLEPPKPEPGYLPDDSDPSATANDVFAIGAILFELLTGVSPADGAVDLAIRDIAPAPLKNPSALNPTLRSLPQVDNVVQQLTSGRMRVRDAVSLLTDALDDPSSTEMFAGPPSGAFLGADTGLGNALSSSVVGAPSESISIVRGGLPLELQASGTAVTLRDAERHGAPLTLVDIAAHGMSGHVARLKAVDERLLIGTTRGALACYDIDSGSFDTIAPSSDGSAVVAIDASNDLTVAATRRGSVICISELGGHVMAPTALVTGISVAETGLRFAVGRTSGDVEVFDIVDGVPVRIDEFTAAEVTGIRLSGDGRELWLSDRDTTTVRDLATHSNFGVVGAANELVETSEALAHHNDD